ncbi:MAG: hypothetical protein AAF610_02645 [Pseudomonadota bacterium]
MQIKDLTLSQPLSLIIFVAAVVAGYQFRRVWKDGDRGLKAWLFGVAAAVGLGIVAFIPVAA